jgi:hypothetical protein
VQFCLVFMLSFVTHLQLMLSLFLSELLYYVHPDLRSLFAFVYYLVDDTLNKVRDMI